MSFFYMATFVAFDNLNELLDGQGYHHFQFCYYGSCSPSDLQCLASIILAVLQL